MTHPSSPPAPMTAEDVHQDYWSPETIAELVNSNRALTARVAELERQVEHWQSVHQTTAEANERLRAELAAARKELKATGERDLTIEAIQRLFRYDPVNGEVFYRVSCGSQQAGDRAGSVVSEGYRMVRFYGRRHPETHIIWVLMTGAWPINSIDHIDRNVQNNRWSNLREATPEQQTANQKLRVDNKSGTRGVHWHKKARRWVASMKVKGKRIHLGSFLHKEEAETAYHAAARARWNEYYHPAKAER